MTEETVRLVVESWTSSWTLVLGLGYIGQTLAWPELGRLGSDTTARTLVLASVAIVLALGLAGFPAAGLAVTGWAIGINLIRKIILTQ
jgi:hypothetical protein